MKLLAIVAIAIFTVVSLGCITNPQTVINKESNLQTDESWCTPGNIVNPQNMSDTGFTIKGITEYGGNQVCEAEWKYEGGSVTEYFTINGTSMLIYRDANGTVVSK